jgi:TPR repeat protein
MDNQQLLRQIQTYFDDYNISINIKDENITLVYDLVINDKIYSDENINGELYRFLGLYYSTKDDDHKMVKYYEMAVELNDVDAMIYFGGFYEKYGGYHNVEKYYKMAIELNSNNAMNLLAQYHERRHEYGNAEKYYKMAAELGNVKAMNSLGLFFRSCHSDEMLYYFQKAVALGYSTSMYNLAKYYGDQGDYENMLKYYLMVFENSPTTLNCIGQKKDIYKHELVFDVVCGEINKVFCKLNNSLLEQLLPHAHLLNQDNLKKQNDKIENKEIEVVMTKYARHFI